MPEENKEQGESMEGILKSIKNIISGEFEKGKEPGVSGEGSEEVLELTKKVSSSPIEKPVENKAWAEDKAKTISETSQPRDVLENIDEALGKKNNEPALVPEPIKEEPEIKHTEAVMPQKPEIAPQLKESTPPTKPLAEESLLTKQSADLAADSLKSLLEKTPKPHVNVSSPLLRSGQTLEDLVIESLKPIMADWLNANLPGIVQQMVEKEIKKIVPRD